jgi:hypothetical protein
MSLRNRIDKLISVLTDRGNQQLLNNYLFLLKVIDNK